MTAEYHHLPDRAAQQVAWSEQTHDDQASTGFALRAIAQSLTFLALTVREDERRREQRDRHEAAQDGLCWSCCDDLSKVTCPSCGSDNGVRRTP